MTPWTYTELAKRLAHPLPESALARHAAGLEAAVRQALRHDLPSAYSVPDLSANRSGNLNTTSIRSAVMKPSAINTPANTETNTEAGVTGQVATQTNTPPPAAHTPKDRAFLRMTLLNVATVLLMVVLSLTSTQSPTQMYAAPTVAVMILIVSIQLLIGIALFL